MHPHDRRPSRQKRLEPLPRPTALTTRARARTHQPRLTLTPAHISTRARPTRTRHIRQASQTRPREVEPAGSAPATLRTASGSKRPHVLRGPARLQWHPAPTARDDGFLGQCLEQPGARVQHPKSKLRQSLDASSIAARASANTDSCGDPERPTVLLEPHAVEFGLFLAGCGRPQEGPERADQGEVRFRGEVPEGAQVGGREAVDEVHG